MLGSSTRPAVWLTGRVIDDASKGRRGGDNDPVSVSVLERLLDQYDFKIIASGVVDRVVKVYFFKIRSESSVSQLAELTVNQASRELECQVRCEALSGAAMESFRAEFWSSLKAIVLMRNEDNYSNVVNVVNGDDEDEGSTEYETASDDDDDAAGGGAYQPPGGLR
jgi:hypothetical protein